MIKSHTTAICFLLMSFINCQIKPSHSANILGLFTSHSSSHLIVQMSVVQVLAQRGHNVTVVVSHKPKVPHKNINVIIIPPTEEHEQRLEQELSRMAKKTNNIFIAFQILGSMNFIIDMQADMLKDIRFTALYDNPENKFDLLICGIFANTFQLGVAAKFKIPVIGIWSGPPVIVIDSVLGNPWESSYVPYMNMVVKTGVKMTFLQRLENLIMNHFIFEMMKVVDIRLRSIYNDLFPTDDSFPTFDDMYSNVSLIFCNSHFSEGSVRPNVPAMIEIGGIQVKRNADSMPEEIAQFLDSSKDHGAILFSLGSNLQSSKINPATVSYIYNVFSQLKQKVIWKWEDSKNTPGNASNILYKPWLPQDDILAHPNLRVFITHAGKGGVAEAQYHGVPMLAMPVFADQHGNADKLVVAGNGRKLELLTVTEENFRANLLEILNNPMYRENVKKFSELYRDRPLHAHESVTFWTEYVLRHHGAPHMQSPLKHMNFIEALNLDVMVVLLIFALILIKFLTVVFRFLRCNSSVGRRQIKTD